MEAQSIDRSNPTPIYYQLKLLILQQIERGELRPGDKVPTEQELCERYDISRTPIRQAFLELVREDVLTRRAGRGTFVAAERTEITQLRVTVPDARWRFPLEQAVEKWAQEHSHRKIELIFEEVSLTDLHDQLSLAVAKGEAPDISLLDSVWVAEFARLRYLCPLSELDPDWHAGVRNDFYPSLLAANGYQGELFAVPVVADATVLWYRRDWFSEQSIEAPSKWDDLVSVGRHFQKAQIRSRYGLGSHPLIFCAGKASGETATYQLLPLVWSAGGDLVSDDKIVLNGPRTREALDFLRALVHKEKLVPPSVVDLPWDGALKAFARGEVAMAFGGTYENYLIQSEAGWEQDEFLERVGFAPVPAGPSGQPATLIGGMAYGVYRQSKSAETALELLRIALSPSVMKPFSLQTGQIPAFTSAADQVVDQEDGFLTATAPLFARARGRTPLPAYDRVSAQFQEMIESCLTGQLPVERAVERAADRISSITGLPLADA